MATPGRKLLDFVAPELDWLDIRWCAEDDDVTVLRELPIVDETALAGGCDGQELANVVNQVS